MQKFVQMYWKACTNDLPQRGMFYEILQESEVIHIVN